MNFAAALAADTTTVRTAPVGPTGIVYHLSPPGVAEVMSLPLGERLIASARARAIQAQQLAGLTPEERRQALGEPAPVRVDWSEVLSQAVDELPGLQRLAALCVRGATVPSGEDWLCLTIDGADGWPAGPAVERMPVEALSYDHLATIAAVATLGGLGALQRTVWLPRRSG